MPESDAPSTPPTTPSPTPSAVDATSNPVPTGPDVGRSIFKALQSTREAIDIAVISSTDATPSEPINPTLPATMEDLMSLETWKEMKPAARHHFLDQFYSITDKYRMEREGRETCASEDLALFQCATAQRSLFARLTDGSVSVMERIDPCVRVRLDKERCVELMTMKAKTLAVFGQEFGKYLRVVDDESKANVQMHLDPNQGGLGR